MISKNKQIWMWCYLLAGSSVFMACQKTGDVIDRYLPAARPSMLTTVISGPAGGASRDSIFWYQDAQGRIDSAYRYDSTARRRYKALSVDRSMPGVISIDDGETGTLKARILFSMQLPYKVEFYERSSNYRQPNSYNFYYGSANNLEYYMDSVYFSMTMEIYGSMSSGHNYPLDAYDKIGTKFSTFYSEHTISNVKWGTDLSSYNFVPFISQVVTSNLANRTPTTICNDIFDAYIWGEVMRPWLSKHIIVAYDIQEFYPFTSTRMTNNYFVKIEPKQIVYSDGKRTISNFYP